MVTSRCYACPSYVNVSTVQDDRHRCIRCGATFCSYHGEPFICNNCLNVLDSPTRQRVTTITNQVKGRVGGGIFLGVLGIILCIIGFATIPWVFSPDYVTYSYGVYSPSYPNVQYLGVPIVLILLGAFMFIGGVLLAVNQTAAVKALRSAISSSPAASPVGIARQGVTPAPRGSSSRSGAPVTTGASPGSTLSHGPQARPNWMPSELPDSLPARASSPAPLLRAQAPVLQPEMPKAARFCVFCGSILPSDSGLRFCPNCGAKI